MLAFQFVPTAAGLFSAVGTPNLQWTVIPVDFPIVSYAWPVEAKTRAFAVVTDLRNEWSSWYT